MNNNTISPITQANALSVLSLKKTIDNLKKQYDEASKTLLENMTKEGLDKITIDEIGEITLKEASERIITDNNRLKSLYADIYNDCIKISQVKAHLVVKA